MNEDLHNLIVQYQRAVEELFPRVASHLKVQLPVSNVEWTLIRPERRGETPDGIKYFMHGYGIAMDDGNLKVDFDLGENGQINGFDAERLAKFVEKNEIKTPLKNRNAIAAAITEAESTGELSYSGYILYYLDHD